MDGTIEGTEYRIAKSRLEALVDGIFAIAMTLLVYTITITKPPAVQAAAVLPSTLVSLIPQVFILVVAFLILAFFWHTHHRHFHFVHTVSPMLLWITIFMLITIVFVPFSTDISGDYPQVEAAVLLFHINICAVGLLFALHWKYISGSPLLCRPVPDPHIIYVWSRETVLIPVVAACAALVSLVTPGGSLLIYLLAPAGWYLLRRYAPPHTVSST